MEVEMERQEQQPLHGTDTESTDGAGSVYSYGSMRDVNQYLRDLHGR